MKLIYTFVLFLVERTCGYEDEIGFNYKKDTVNAFRVYNGNSVGNDNECSKIFDIKIELLCGVLPTPEPTKAPTAQLLGTFTIKLNVFAWTVDLYNDTP